MNNSINLLVDKKNQRLGRGGTLRILRLSAIVLLFIIASSSIILFILIALSPLPNLKAQERLARITLSQEHTDMAKLFLIKERVAAVEQILAKRRMYDRPLEIIQSLLPNGVEVEALKVEKNTVSLTVSSKSLTLLNTFVASLTGEVNQKKVFSQLSMGNLSIEATKNRYLVTLVLLLI
jgi:Tfp pilus assembly protein PilN